MLLNAVPDDFSLTHSLILSCVFRSNYTSLLLHYERQQEATPFAGVMMVNARTGEHEYLLDPDGTDLARLTGITYRDGKLFMGSLKDNYIAEYTL